MPNYNLNYGSQYIDNEDINEVKKVLKSPFLTKGPKIEEFEKYFLKKLNQNLQYLVRVEQLHYTSFIDHLK